MKSLSFPLDLGWPVTGFDLQNLAKVTWDFQALIFRGLGAPAASVFGSQQGWKMPESPRQPEEKPRAGPPRPQTQD